MSGNVIQAPFYNSGLTADDINNMIDAKLTPIINSLSLKADKKNIVSIADATIARDESAGGGWYKVADAAITTNNRNCTWRIVFSTDSKRISCELNLSTRGTGSGINVYSPVIYSDEAISPFDVKIVTENSDVKKVELWVKLAGSYRGGAVTELNDGSIYGTNEKGMWTYYNGSGGGQSEPQTDLDTNRIVYSVINYVRSHS